MTDAAEKSTLLRVLLIGASGVIIVAGMKAAASILVPFLLAVFIAIIAAPLFLGLQRRGASSGVALLAMILILVVAGFLGVSVVRTSLSDFSSNLPKYQVRLQEQTGHLWQWLEDKGFGPADQVVSEVLSPQVAMRYLGEATSTLSGMLTRAFLILLVVIFIFLEATLLPAKLRSLPGLTDATWAGLEGMVENVRKYMSMKTLTSGLTGILVAVLAAVLGIDYPVLLGLAAFMLNYVPNVGSFIAAIPGILLAFIEFGLGTAAIAAVGYVIINVTIGNVIEPRFMGRGLGLSPLVILISMIFWGWVLGPVGMLLSVPLTIAVKVALESGDETRGIALLMGSRPDRD